MKIQKANGHKVVGYCRVSTNEQVQEGISLDAQRAKISSYCELHGLELVDILADEGISGKNLKGRPGVQKVLSLISGGEVDGLVILKLDRFCRNTRESLEVAEMFKAKGASLHSISEKIDTDNAIGEFFFTLMAALGQMERKQIGERTATALSFKRSRGEKTGGDVPYGYDLAPSGALSPSPREQEALGLIHELKGKGHSLRSICRELEKEGYKTKKGKGIWHPQGVKQILERKAA